MNVSKIKLRQIIKSIRNQGFWIIAFYDGYMFTDNKEWLDKYINFRFAEINDELATLERMRN